MARTVALIGVAIVAGAIGFFAGLFVLLAFTGLERPDWAPVAHLTGVGLAAGLGTAVIARLPLEKAAALIGSSSATGALAGLVVKSTVDSFEWAILVGLGIALAAAVIASRLDVQPSEAAA